jgi:hypothetical protein
MCSAGTPASDTSETKLCRSFLGENGRLREMGAGVDRLVNLDRQDFQARIID